MFLLNTGIFAQQNSFVIAENYFRNSEYEKALQYYQELYQSSPYNTTYLKRLMSCYQELNQFDKVEQTLVSKLQQYPDQLYLEVLLGHNYERQQRHTEAKEHYEKAIQAVQQGNGYASVIANLFKDFSKLDLAIQAYETILVQNPNANFGFQLAQIYGEQGNFAKMFNSYFDLVDKNENYLSNVKYFSNRYLSDNPDDPNNQLFKKGLLKKSISNPKDIWNDLLGWYFIKQKQFGKALIQYKALLARNPDNLANIKNLNRLAFDAEDYDTSEKCSALIIAKTNYERDKFSAIYIQLQIAIQKKYPDVLERFESILKEYKNSRHTIPVKIAYANYYSYTLKQPEKGIAILEQALRESTSKFSKGRIKLNLAQLLVFTENFNRALIYFSQVQSQFKNHPLGQEARFKVAQTSYFKNDFKWAKAQLKVLKGSATQLIANDAAELFLTISDNQPKDSTATGLAQYSKADFLSYQRKNDQAIPILQELISSYKNQPIEDEAQYKLGVLYIDEKKYLEAIDCFEKVIAIDAKGILVDNALYQLGNLYLNQLEDTEKAATYFQKIIFDHPSSIYLIDARKKYRTLRGDQL